MSQIIDSALPASTASASSDPLAAVAAAHPVSVPAYTPQERKDALAYWTPARMKAVGRSVGLGPTGPTGPTGPKAKPSTARSAAPSPSSATPPPAPSSARSS
ncbi:hypothetical protein ACIPPS_08230 [Streptomyces sp. NPDC090127]|uniref:hypothetical protein n=1 Tax=Streptomyces sp. NPDC090127 TaxID=3365953 RepID=UPI003805942F